MSGRRRTASILNFSLDPEKRTYKSSDPDKLAQRIVDIVQVNTRSELQKFTLEEALRQSGGIRREVLARTERPGVGEHGHRVRRAVLHFHPTDA